MGNSVGMIELSSIAKGIETCDSMIKSADVELLRASTICPGKYMVIIGGDTGSVEAAMKVGEEVAAQFLVDKLLIANVSEQLMPAISSTSQVPTEGAIGVIEFYSVASAIVAADTAAKAAAINLIEVRTGFAIGGKGFVTMSGDVSAITEAIKAAEAASELMVHSVVIPRPLDKLYESLM
ncbi:BMC domain-containing protein [Candidatus Galacturonibacter soehngenii]|uniref:BMC domain-containing protein n=1 Tax=Candidatus Galacturonatibacter soehngenii TaxID=2307010 RepID=A0A7V7QP36_9FIRM|nr:BMC domain-containing protein [Candidatus Galacturonibacter soehngenii]KAB1440635.1 BMC domain-containing protein [Candidatus Galacturonibacter soehngenii]MBA4687897.1 BMC domain-containing protein [Candidatus Galacturonibacter soehngenii]